MQVQWMQKSKTLIEEQFDQKVSMALCKAVDQAAEDNKTVEINHQCSFPGMEGASCCKNVMDNYVAEGNINEVVSDAFEYYDIDMPFVLGVQDKAECLPSENEEKIAYTCSLNPILPNEDLQLSVNFPSKKEYVKTQMSFMTFSSILILLLITVVFVYANYSLIKQQRISEKNKDFFNHMAHEFKTPLTNIGLASKLLSKKSDDQLVTMIQKENSALSKHVDNVLSMACLERGEYEMAIKEIDLVALVQNLIANLEIRIANEGIKIQLDALQSKIMVKADPFHLSNAIRNIINNAINYNDNSPLIKVNIQESENEAIVRIKDNGIGISKSDQALIFDKFHRIKKGNLYNKSGFGLGLSYVKKIVDIHQGSIKVNSELNKGTTFNLSLPKIAV